MPVGWRDGIFQVALFYDVLPLSTKRAFLVLPIDYIEEYEDYGCDVTYSVVVTGQRILCNATNILQSTVL